MAISHAMQKYFDGEQLLKKFESGEISPQMMPVYITHAKNQAKFLAVEIAAQNTYGQHEVTRKNLRHSGFISTESIPNQTEIEAVFPCPEQGDMSITRFSCLDYSGHPDHHTQLRQERLKAIQQQEYMEQADAELPRGGNPLSTLAVIVLVFMVSISCMIWGYTFYKAQSVPEYISTTPSRTAVILHERELGQRK